MKRNRLMAALAALALAMGLAPATALAADTVRVPVPQASEYEEPVYDGTEKMPPFPTNGLYNVTYDGEPTDAGEYEAELELINKEESVWVNEADEELGTENQTVPWNILPANVDPEKLEIEIANQEYDGKPKTPEPTVVYDGKTLEKDRDYTVAYERNVEPGVALATIDFKGNYAGNAVKSFQVTIQGKLPLSLPKQINILVYNGTEQTGLESFEDVYTVSGGSAVNAGEHQATLSLVHKDQLIWYDKERGIASSEDQTVTWKIAPKAVLSSEVTVSGVVDQTYTGSPRTPKPTVVYQGKTLAEGTDYQVAYENNTAVGPARMIITFIGNYTGTYNTSFQIKRAYTPSSSYKSSIPATGDNSNSALVIGVAAAAAGGLLAAWFLLRRKKDDTK